MKRAHLEKKIIEVLEHNHYCSLATVENGKPKCRYMVLHHEQLQVYLASHRLTHKVEEINKNPNVCVLLGYEIEGSKEVIEIEGTCTVSTSEKLKEKLWNKELEKWFHGVHDPNYFVLKVEPKKIYYISKEREHFIWEKE